MILFLSKYPTTNEEFRDGFFQRVLNIDELFFNQEKVYLAVSPYRYFKKSYLVQKDNRIVIRCNLLLHIVLIIRFFSQANIIYIQSIHNILYSFLFIKFFKKKYLLDLHGLVPEEFEMFKDYRRAKIFNAIEKLIYNDLDYVVGVTNKLINFYQIKYPKAKAKYIIYPILPNNLTEITEIELKEVCQDSKVNFIYSGNLQPWQNIDLMIYHIKRLSGCDNYFFQILTGNTGEMKKKFINADIDMSHIDIRGVNANELDIYYKKAHYGFILREDVPVNNVACPTKLIEYMNYGIVPIVLSEDIGDFVSMGYEKLEIVNISSCLKPKKSKRNIEIIKNIYQESNRGRQNLQELYKNSLIK